MLLKKGQTIPIWIRKFLASGDYQKAEQRLLLLALTEEDVILQEKPGFVWKKADAQQMREQGKKLLDDWWKTKPWQPLQEQDA